MFREEVLMNISSKEDFIKKNSIYLISQKQRDSFFELVFYSCYADIKIDDVSKFLYEQLEAIVFLFNVQTKSK